MTLNNLFILIFTLIIRIGDSNTVIASSLYPQYEYYAVNGWSAKLAADDKIFEYYVCSKQNVIFVIGLGTNDHWDDISYDRDMKVIGTKILNCGNSVAFLRIPNLVNRNDVILRMNKKLLDVSVKLNVKFISYEMNDDELYDGVHLNNIAHARVNSAIENELR
jgi:hypothetical protein